MLPVAEVDYDRIAADLVARGLGPAAIMALECGKPLSFVGSQLLVFLDPIVELFVQVPAYAQWIHVLEDRERIERLIVAVEASL